MAVTKSEITATAIYKITSKIDGKICWAVPSDSDPNKMYRTCFDELTHGWTCDCKHGQVQAERGQDAKCKHVRAAQTSIKANKESSQVTSPVPPRRQVEAWTDEEERRYNAPLNGNRERKMEVAPSGRSVWMR